MGNTAQTNALDTVTIIAREIAHKAQDPRTQETLPISLFPSRDTLLSNAFPDELPKSADVQDLPKLEVPFDTLSLPRIVARSTSSTDHTSDTTLPGAETQRASTMEEFLSRSSHSIVKLRDLMREPLSEEQRELANNLFELAYEACEKTFGDDDEGLSRERVRAKILDPEGSWDFILVANLKEQTIAAGYVIHQGIADGLKFSVAEYMWVDQAFRREGLGTLFFRHLTSELRSQGVELHFGEIHDPYLAKLPLAEIRAKSPAGDKKPFDPATQLAFWKKQGRLVVDTFWPQPAMATGLREVTKWQLSVQPLVEGHSSLTPSQVLSIWNTLYARSEPEMELDVSSSRAKLMEWLAPYSRSGALINFISIDSPRTWTIQQMIRSSTETPRLMESSPA